MLTVCNLQKRMAPQVGLEPTTLRLTAGCSAIELLRSVCALPHRIKSYCSGRCALRQRKAESGAQGADTGCNFGAGECFLPRHDLRGEVAHRTTDPALPHMVCDGSREMIHLSSSSWRLAGALYGGAPADALAAMTKLESAVPQ